MIVDIVPKTNSEYSCVKKSNDFYTIRLDLTLSSPYVGGDTTDMGNVGHICRMITYATVVRERLLKTFIQNIFGFVLKYCVRCRTK